MKSGNLAARRQAAAAKGAEPIGFALAALVLLLVPFVLSGQQFYMDTIIQFLLWAAAAGAWNLAGGFVGLLSLGHALFFGIGAYVSSVLFVKLGVSPWIGMPAGAAAAGCVSLIIGLLTLRLKGPYFSLATIAFAEVGMILCTNWKEVTQGAQGINIPYKPGFENMIFDSKTPYYFIVLALCLIPYAIAQWFKRSKFGFELRAVRDNEDAAQALGVNSVRVKVSVFVLSAMLTSLCGTFYAQYIAIIEPLHEFSFAMSVQMMLMSMIGGLGTTFGPIFGALVITGMNTGLHDLLQGAHGGMQGIVYGSLLVLVVLFLPEGFMPWFARGWRNYGRRVKHGDYVVGAGTHEALRRVDGGE